MGFCPFGNSQDKTNINNACIISCALYDKKSKQCCVKLIAESLIQLAQSNNKEKVKN